MSIEAVAIALHHSQAKGTAKLVLIGIANHDGDAGSFPKVATLARYANVHPRRIPEAVAQLVALGEVVVHLKDGGTRTGPRAVRAEVAPNMYDITLTCPPNCDGSSRHVLLSPEGQALKFGRSYQGAYSGVREKDQEAVERGKQSWDKRQGLSVDKSVDSAPQDVPGPSDGNSTSDENSTRSSDGNSTSPSAENSTTKNLPTNQTMNPAWVPSVTSAGGPVEKSAHCEGLHPADGGPHKNCAWRGCGCDCHGIRSVVPALPRATPSNDAAKGKGVKAPAALTDEERSRVRRGAALARAALRGQLGTNEAKDGGE